MSCLKDLSDAARPRPWSCRPRPHDDWGVIRGREIQDDEIGPVNPPVTQSKASWDEMDNFAAHRTAGTDPMEPNGRFIVELVNAYREGRLVEIDPEAPPLTAVNAKTDAP